MKRAFACHDVLSALSQLATSESSGGLIQRELQLAKVIIGLLDADSLTCKIISLTVTNQIDTRPDIARIYNVKCAGIVFDYAESC